MLKLYPYLKETIWGGTALKSVYDTKLENIAEAWILSAHTKGNSRVIGGRFDGDDFSTVLNTLGKEALGKNAEKFGSFPQLIKLLNAKEDLSVQVHPDDTYAKQNEASSGKCEMWYILDAKEGAGLYLGFDKEYSKSEIKSRIEKGSLTDILSFVPVKKGDCFFIPPGTVHSIGRGILLAEIQQSSDVTYRVFDYDRVGKDGKKRELHIADALEVISPVPYIKKDFGPHLASCEYFTVDKLDLTADTEVGFADSFCTVVFLSKGKIGDVDADAFDTFFLTAGETETLGSGSAVLISYLN